MSNTIGIIGSGTMGTGIAQVAGTNGCTTLVYDSNENALKKSQSSINRILDRLIEKEKIQLSDKEFILSNIEYSTGLNSLSKCDLVIEAIVENKDVKNQVFNELEQIIDDACIVATNTSSLSVTSLASSLDKPERFLGIHFFNPVPLMQLVEIIPAVQTNEPTLTIA